MAKDEINAFLGAGTSYQGKLLFQGSVRIDGEFRGEVESEGTLVVGREAKLLGQIKVGQLIVSGHINGEIIATDKVTLHSKANLVGSVRTPSLVVEDGAVLEGEVKMGSTIDPVTVDSSKLGENTSIIVEQPETESEKSDK